MKKNILKFISIITMLLLSSCAQHKPQTYTIIWANYDGSILEVDENVKEGDIPTFDQENPSKSSTEKYEYTFKGWSPEVSIATSNQRYTATFEETIREYTVKFNSNGGPTLEDQNIKYGNKVTKPEGYCRTGYEFVSWTYQGEEWDFDKNEVKQNMTLEANWDIIIYSINYDLKGGINHLDNPTNYTIEDTKPLYNPTKTGYRFDGWYNNDIKIESITPGMYGDITLTAHYSIAYYNVNVTTSDINKGTVTGSGIYEYGSEITIVATPNTGYNFDGWYINDIKISQEASYTIIVPSYDISYEARWSTITYTISYNLDGGINSEDNPNNYTIEDNKTLYEATKTGFTFTGWYNNDTKVESITPGTYGDITLTAHWSINSYNIYLINIDSTKGTISGGGNFEYGTEIALTATPNEGFVFKGWYYDEACNLHCHSESSFKFIVESDLTLYAKFWTPEEKTSWEIAHGVIPQINQETKTITYGLYPQSHVNDDALIAELNKLDENYIDSRVYAYSYNGEYYRKAEGKPLDKNTRFDDGTLINEDDIYWFKCKPIEWKILQNIDNDYLLIPTTLIDVSLFSIREFCEYIDSGIRGWINNNFYSCAFGLGDDYIIKGSQTYFDNASMLSEDDYKNSEFGFSPDDHSDTRLCKPTDWAKCNKSFVFSDGYGRYWTRTSSSSAASARIVNNDYFVEMAINTIGICVRPCVSVEI